jgi:hypothetical protein
MARFVANERDASWFWSDDKSLFDVGPPAIAEKICHPNPILPKGRHTAADTEFTSAHGPNCQIFIPLRAGT